jgi:hypothetical protein
MLWRYTLSGALFALISLSLKGEPIGAWPTPVLACALTGLLIGLYQRRRERRAEAAALLLERGRS